MITCGGDQIRYSNMSNMRNAQYDGCDICASGVGLV